MSDRYDLCRALARDAGKLAHRGFGASDAKLKGRHDVVTAMDREVERYIRAAIAARYPQDAVIGERQLFADGRWQTAQVFDRVKLPIAARLTGPAIVHQMDATTVIEPGALAAVDAIGNLRIVVGGGP